MTAEIKDRKVMENNLGRTKIGIEIERERERERGGGWREKGGGKIKNHTHI